MLCKCLNDREQERAIRSTIGQEIALILWLDELDVDTLKEEQEEQDILALSAAPTFPPHEVIRAWRPMWQRSVWDRVGQLLEGLLFL
jgi:hypothetical protein